MNTYNKIDNTMSYLVDIEYTQLQCSTCVWNNPTTCKLCSKSPNGLDKRIYKDNGDICDNNGNVILTFYDIKG